MRKHLLAAVLVLVIAACVAFVTPSNFVASAEYQLSTPAGVVLQQTGDNYFIVWGRVTDNNGYVVEIDGNEYTTLQNVESYNIDELAVGRAYSVRVKALGADGNTDSAFSQAVNIVKKGKLTAPTNLDVSPALSLTWDKVTGAVGYKVTVNGIIIAAAATETAVDLFDKLYSTGDYTVKIKALGDNALLLDSDYSADYVYTFKKTLAAPANLAVTPADGKIIASWDKVTYADAYEVDINGVAVNAASNSLDITDYITEVTDYSIKVRCKAAGNFNASAYSAAVVYGNVADIAAPQLVKANDLISWAAPEGADRYAVLVRNSAGEVYTNTEYAVTSLNMAEITEGKPAGDYIVEVQALKNGNYNASDIVYITYLKYEKLAAPTLSVNGTVISWTAIPNAVNYTVKVDGRERSATYTALSYDLAVDLAECKTYKVTVTANANGWYTASDAAEYDYVYGGKLGKPDVSAEGLNVNWTAVLGATSYRVTVDGVEVATGVTALTYDVSEYCTEEKEYTVTVNAVAAGYTAGDAVGVTVVGVHTQAETVRYYINAQNIDDYLVYVDGKKTDYTISGNCVTLPSTAEKLIIVPDADTYEAYDGADVAGTRLFREITLKQTNYSEEHQAYVVSANSLNIAALAEDANSVGTEEGIAKITHSSYDYYYQVKAGAKNPTEVG